MRQKNKKSVSEEDVVFDDDNVANSLKKLHEKLKQAVALKQEYLDGWQRAKADYANLKKEQNRLHIVVRVEAKTELLHEFLDLADSFDLAFSNKKAWEELPQDWRIGMEHIHSKLLSIFKAHRMSVIDPAGKVFIQALHHSMATVATNDKSEDGKVAEVLQKGYLMDGELMRAARVKVYQYNKK